MNCFALFERPAARWFMLLLVSLLTTPVRGAAQNAQLHPDTLARRLDRLVPSLELPGAPGGAVAIVRRDGATLARTFGLADLESGTAITTSTVFDDASLAKPFTALAVAKLTARAICRSGIGCGPTCRTYLDHG